MRKALLVLALALLALPGWAKAAPLEASGLVSGSITVNPDGSVKSFTLDWRDELPAGVAALIDKSVSRWNFQPVVKDGVAVTARALMSVRVVAREGAAPGTLELRVQAAAFGDDVADESGRRSGCTPGSCLQRNKLAQPLAYPMALLRAGVEGTVYLVQDIGRDGQVRQQAVRQVNLWQRLDVAQEHTFRTALAKAALRAGNQFHYSFPTVGEAAGEDHMVVVTPINFNLRLPTETSATQHWKWDAYFPGPKQDIPWADRDKAKIADTDAVPNEGVFVADARFKLLTPLAPPDPQPASDGNHDQG